MALSVRHICSQGQAANRSKSGQRAVPALAGGVLRPKSVTKRRLVTKALDGGNDDKKILRREEEPEEYWVSKSERKGANPLSDPLAIIGLTAIFLPFVLLLIAIATGLIDTSVYR